MADGLDAVVFVAFVDPSALPDRLPLRAIALDHVRWRPARSCIPISQCRHSREATRRRGWSITPYPWGNAKYENPSIFTGDGRDTWRVPDGLTNPVVSPNGGYFSDPDMVWLADQRQFRLYYRQVSTENEILVTTSSDGVRWGASQTVLRAPNHQAVSPTVVRRSPTDWLMWTVNSGSSGCSSPSTTVELRRSVDGIGVVGANNGCRCRKPASCPGTSKCSGFRRCGSTGRCSTERSPGSCTTEALYLATSADGVTWRTYRSPVLRRGAIPEFADIVYRATFAYDAERDLVSLWHSGATTRRAATSGAPRSSVAAARICSSESVALKPRHSSTRRRRRHSRTTLRPDPRFGRAAAAGLLPLRTHVDIE